MELLMKQQEEDKKIFKLKNIYGLLKIKYYGLKWLNQIGSRRLKSMKEYHYYLLGDKSTR